ncbi:MAG: glycosyltransferase family 4 protein [Bacteroidales bacterium]|nr:glycosyltransferase family 4 protein [Bacteroidales bacterium]
MMRSKILLVSPLPPPVGGIGTWTKHILSYFENNSQCELIHYNTAVIKRRITQHSNIVRIIGGVKEMKHNIPLIVEIVKMKKPDVVHLISSAYYGLFRDFVLLGRLKKLGVKTVIHFRFGRIPSLSKQNNWEWKMICLVVNRAGKVIVIDKKSFETLIEHGYKNIEYLPNPIAKDIEDMERITDVDFSERQKGYVLFVGQVAPKKGIMELVTACADLEMVRQLTLIGPYEKKIEQQIRHIASKRDDGRWLQLKDVQNTEVVLESMRKCNVFVLPSYTEGFPNVILESMITGCPIVATSVGAVDDMLNTKDSKPAGICVKPQDIDKLKAAIQTFLTNSELAEQMGLIAKERVLKEYSTEIICDKMIKIWQSMQVETN